MDEARRAELKARRAALLEAAAARDWAARRAEFVQMVPILKALEAAGEDYDSDSYRGVRGRFNDWAHYPDRHAMHEHSCEDLPADPAARDVAILAPLRARLGDDGSVTVILRRERLVLTLHLPVLARHLPTLFENAKGDWLAFVAPPADWIVATLHLDWLGVSRIFTGTLGEEGG